MANIIAEEHVRCAPEITAALIEPALRRIAQGEELAVRLPADVIGIHSPLALEQGVRFRVAHARDQSGLNDVVTIAWEPEGDVLVPAFRGILTSDGDVGTSLITLQGAYDAPGGLVGKVLDEGFGFWIARATMHDLLKRLARAIEALDAERAAGFPPPQPSG